MIRPFVFCGVLILIKFKNFNGNYMIAISYIILWLPAYLFLIASFGMISELVGMVMLCVFLVIFKKAYFLMYPNGYYYSKRNNYLFLIVFFGQVFAMLFLMHLNSISNN